MQRYEWYAVAATVGAAWFGYQLFGPNPPIVVSRETTYLTEPLAEDGLPDYAKWFLDQQRAGVTPENNAAIPLLQAMWPAGIKPEHQKLICDEIGMKVPEREGMWDPTADWERDNSVVRATTLMLLAREDIVPRQPIGTQADFEAWKRDYAEDDPANGSLIEEAEQMAVDLIRQSANMPWSEKDLPALAAWVKQSDGFYEQLERASRLDHFYIPSGTFFTDQFVSFVDADMPQYPMRRLAVDVVCCRAMLHLKSGKHATAVVDWETAHRLASIPIDDSVIGQLVEVACLRTNLFATAAFFDGSLAAEDQQLLRRSLSTIEWRHGMDLALGLQDRIATITAVLPLTSHRNNLLGCGLFAPDEGRAFLWLVRTRIDWNRVLAGLNARFDRLMEVARIDNYQNRSQAIRRMDDDLRELNWDSFSPTYVVLSIQERSDFVEDFLAAVAMGGLPIARNSEDFFNADLQLTQIAAGLAVYRAEHGSYPAALSDLVPDLLAEVPVDNYLGKPLMYRRIGEGYLLVNVGPNGESDGGMNAKLGYYDGYDVTDLNQPSIRKLLGLPASDDDLRESIPEASDDLSIRMPLPRVDWQAIRVGTERE